MPHLQKRYLLPLLEKLSGFFPLIGILGHRQVGKTTLLQTISDDYRSMDQLSERKKATADPESYIEALRGSKTILDESQLVPELFPALKERVRKNKKPGQFFLSGSVRFTSRAMIRESLTGRIRYAELLPLTISEIENDVLPSIILQLLDTKDLTHFLSQLSITKTHLNSRQRAIQSYLKKGGLPGVCFIREDKIRSGQIQDQLQTILDRDIRLVYPTSLAFQQIYEYLRSLAIRQGRPIHHQELKRETEITPPTQQKLLYALEAVFLIRRIPIEGGKSGFTVFLEDQAESHFLSERNLSDASQLTQLLFINIRAEFYYRLEKSAYFFQYRSLGGVIIPLAIRHQESVLGFMPIQAVNPSRAEILAAQSFLKTYLNSKLVFFNMDRQAVAINDRLVSLPLETLL